MHTERLDAANPAHLARAADLLRRGGTVAFPTETVYGLGANALHPAAVEKIFVAKQRPHWDPLIVHIATPAMLALIATPASPTAQSLINRFWPGPLTLLLPRTPLIADIVTAGRPLVGVRMPAHPVALALIQAAGVPIAAPSANTFGHTSPTTAAHVLADLDGRIDAILDGGPTQVGLESTVVGLEPTSRFGGWQDVTIYRKGAVTESDLAETDGVGLVQPFQPLEQGSHPPESLPSPGVGIRHYAPRATLILVAEAKDASTQNTSSAERALGNAIDEATTTTSRVAVMLPQGWNPSAADLKFSWGPWHDPDHLAARLYSGLRQLDDSGATIILCPVPQGHGIAAAIRDRLQKAARKA